MTLLAWCVAWILDVVIGDPPHWPHPVRWIGRLIAVSQRVVRRVCHSDRALRIGGGVMWLVVIGLTWGVAWGVLALAHGIHPWLGWLVEVWMIFTALAGRCLAQSAMAVARGVAGGSLLLIPLACNMFGIPNDVAMQVVAVGFIIGVLQDSCETALNSSTDALFTAAACMAEDDQLAKNALRG